MKFQCLQTWKFENSMIHIKFYINFAKILYFERRKNLRIKTSKIKNSIKSKISKNSTLFFNNEKLESSIIG